MRIIVDAQRCMGHGQCYAHAPDVYAPDEAGYCTVAKSDIEVDDVQHAAEGAEACPESAITLGQERDA